MGFLNHDPQREIRDQRGPQDWQMGVLTSVKIRLAGERLYHPQYGWVWHYKGNYYRDLE